MKTDLTIVSGLIDLGRGEIADGFKRDFNHYIESFSRFLEIDLPMVLFVTEDLTELVNNVRGNKPTQTIIISKEYIKRQFPFYAETNKIRQKENWINRAGWIPDSPQATMDLYNPFVMNKHFFLNDATLYNPFNSSHFVWIDGGISNTIGEPAQHIHQGFAERYVKYVKKMQYVTFPYDGKVEVHGFEKRAMDKLAGEETTYVARGGVFGGTVDAINEMNTHYYDLLSNTLSAGLMGTEESLFTILTYTHKHLCEKHPIDSNGLVYKYFNEMNAKEYKETRELAIYSLTYNEPKQFEIWVDRFNEVLGNQANQIKKYVLNNSDDPNVEEEYTQLFEKHGFEEFKFDNIGICDGRHYIAEHFHESEHDYMIFFEDDMLLENKNGICKNGFRQAVPELFDRAISILDQEKLDYLKLSFSELFGDNHDNWAWYNVPNKTRKEFFKNEYGEHVSVKKTKIFYTGSYKKVPYAVGEYHYCNWPTLFDKEGNYKVFLDTVYEYRYESTWMSQVMMDMRQGKIRAGCLLASPITHSRKYHYGEDKRRENNHS